MTHHMELNLVVNMLNDFASGESSLNRALQFYAMSGGIANCAGLEEQGSYHRRNDFHGTPWPSVCVLVTVLVS